ncbi:non-ribosomal peptide synthase protein (TIGR01720 family)/amino acid adenylation domain-containing protein [Paenibacillus cellulosilyticus]|uniref:Non-ribosomal peptide synthase protein (TIGR01720 family)/amino acid adenylation domain-containing protein n=2 Tax=Paenibacillus cellulosilyticus TaxID=375489 RepID=A0A2V2YYQ3_9BACL|nr:non-ribosomal peptide synthase protein (TIGR01720 family)/amino acid adenylation domain-containing protein [Paenibacillus cellulosilyticus]
MTQENPKLELLQSQMRIWFIEEIFQSSPIYNIGGAVLFQAEICEERLEQAIVQAVARHDGLRMQLALENGEPRQYITDHVPQSLEKVDFSTEPDPEQAFQTWLKEASETPFQLYGSGLYQFVLVRVSDRESGYLLKFHHLVADGWAMKIVTEDIMALYEQLLSGEEAVLPPAPSFIHAVEDERRYLESDRFRKNKAYWLEKFAELPEDDADLPVFADYEARRSTFRLNSHTTSLIRQWTARTGLSENVFFTTLAGLYLSKWKRKHDLVLGIPVLNRSGRTERQTMGMFASLMPLRVRLDKDHTFKQLAAEVGRELKSGFFHQRYPYNFLVRNLQQSCALQGQLVDVCVNYSNAALLQEYGGLPIRNVDFFPGYQTYDLHLLIKDWGDEERIRIDIEYKTGLYSEAEIDAMAVRLERLIVRICTEPDIQVDSLQLIGDEESEQLLNKGAGPVADSGPYLFIDEWLAHQARENADLPALRFGHKRFTYKQLNESVDRIASRLSASGIQEGDIVGLCAARSHEIVEIVFGILRAGAAYLPLDPAYPSERIRLMLDKCGAAAVIAEDRQFGIVSSLHPKALRAEELIKPEQRSTEGRHYFSALSSRSAQSPAYVIFTSGSTGQPKGVVVEHAALMNRLMWMQRQYPLEPGDVVLHKTPFTFDVSVWELLWWTISGAECCVLPHGAEKDPKLIAETMEASQVTAVHFVPSMLGAFLTALEAGIIHVDQLRTVRRLFASGEALPADYVRRFYSLLKASLHNLYGPTEAAIDVTYFDCLPPDNSDCSVSIGRPIANIRLYIVDESLQLVPDGAEGELCIAGVGLARGYVGDDLLTEARFVRLPLTGERIYRTGDAAKWLPDGKLAYLGRIDQQVKIRGYRIEPGEIEQQLLGCPQVEEAAVIARTDAAGEKFLCAYVATSEPVTIEMLREHLLATLPIYMVPARFVFMERLPLTTHGKIDRKSLPDPPVIMSITEDDDLGDERHKLFLQIVRTVLGNDGIGWSNNFFHVGGDSIKAIQIAAKLHEQGIALQAQQLLEKPVLREAASALTQHTAKSEYVPAGAVNPTPITEWFWSKELAEPKHFNQSVVLRLIRAVDSAALEQALEELLQSWDAFALIVHPDNKALYYRTGERNTFRIETVDLSEQDTHQIHASFEAWADHWKSSIDWNDGPLFKAAIVRLPDGESRLLLTAHHLIVDGVSWRLIIDRLSAILEGSEGMRSSSVAFGAYAEQLHAGPAKDRAMKELSYWLRETTAIPISLPTDCDRGPDLLKYCATVGLTLDRAHTEQLMGSANDSYRTRTQELLLASFSLAVQHVTGRSGVLGFMVEGHGRDGGSDILPVDGTVGWFTSIYPVNVMLDGLDITKRITSVKEKLRAVPDGGKGYGMLVYLMRELEPLDESVRVRFNYLGELDAGLDSDWFALTDESYGKDVSPENRLGCLLDVNVFVYDGRLRAFIAYSRNSFYDDTISGLVRQWKEQLEAMLRHCTEQRAVDLTVSDFAWSGLSQDELDGLFG